MRTISVTPFLLYKSPCDTSGINGEPAYCLEPLPPTEKSSTPRWQSSAGIKVLNRWSCPYSRRHDLKDIAKAQLPAILVGNGHRLSRMCQSNLARSIWRRSTILKNCERNTYQARKPFQAGRRVSFVSELRHSTVELPITRPTTVWQPLFRVHSRVSITEEGNVRWCYVMGNELWQTTQVLTIGSIAIGFVL